MSAFILRVSFLGVLFASVALPAVAQTGTILKIAPGATIIAEGDSLTYGMDISGEGEDTQINGAKFPRSHSPYPETLEEKLDGCATVINHGFPGDRSIDGLIRWQDSPSADLYIIMFGTNDAVNYGQRPLGKLTADSFRRVLDALVKRRVEAGAHVMLLSPIPVRNPKSDAEVEPFRDVVRDYAQLHGLWFIDTTKIMQGPDIWTKDGIHPSVAFNQALAGAIAAQISCKGSSRQRQ